jgi:hypothetical protein
VSAQKKILMNRTIAEHSMFEMLDTAQRGATDGSWLSGRKPKRI